MIVSILFLCTIDREQAQLELGRRKHMLHLHSYGLASRQEKQRGMGGSEMVNTAVHHASACLVYALAAEITSSSVLINQPTLPCLIRGWEMFVWGFIPYQEYK